MMSLKECFWRVFCDFFAILPKLGPSKKFRLMSLIEVNCALKKAVMGLIVGHLWGLAVAPCKSSFFLGIEGNSLPLEKAELETEWVFMRWFWREETMLLCKKSIWSRSCSDAWALTNGRSGLVRAAAVSRATEVLSFTLYLWQYSQIPKIAKGYVS